ncbi:Zinc knuckle [Carex littledalei]|uniref:Zinc knuckle n=1 Tax=Carex littledalei TaxID=544730 RepID=A0A833R6K2_9POAL|nr:Zinc knuckle [Carex littledalei]
MDQSNEGLIRKFAGLQTTDQGSGIIISQRGPWTYMQDLALVAHCASANEVNDSKLNQVELWVQYHNTPFETLTENSVTRITEPVGIALSESIAAYHNGKQFFRIKILVPLTEPVKDKLTVDHPTQGEIEVFLVYEKIGRICLFCGSMGHEISSCTDRAIQAINPAQAEARAVLEGFTTLIELGGNEGIAYSDSKETVLALASRQPNITDWRSFDEIWKAWNIQAWAGRIKALHCNREHQSLAIENAGDVIFRLVIEQAHEIAREWASNASVRSGGRTSLTVALFPTLLLLVGEGKSKTAATWIREVKVERLIKLVSGLRRWNEHDLVLALLERGGPSARSAVVECLS